MKFEGLIFSLFSVLLLIGIANAQSYHEQVYNTTLLNQSSCPFYYITISTNGNVMNCYAITWLNPNPATSIHTYAVVNVSFGRPLFFYYNSSRNPNANNESNLIFIQVNGTSISLPAKSSILISFYPNGSVFENNNLLYKFSKPQDEIGLYEIGLTNVPYYYNINVVIKQPTTLNIFLPNKNIVIGYEHSFDNLTITETNNIDMLELIHDVNTTYITIANSTSPLIYNVYKLIPRFAKTNTYFVTYPFANNSEKQFWLLAYDKSFSNTLFHSIIINIFKPYLWIGNSKPAFEANVVGGKVLEINFTNVNASLVSSRAYFNFIFENKTIIPTQTFKGTGNLTFNMATNPNETEIISGNLIYKYDNETYYYNFTNLSLMQGQLKRIVIPVIPKNITKTTTAKCNIELCILLILIIIILLIIITWRIKKHFEKKKRKI